MLPPKRAICLALTEYNHILISLINSKFQTKTKLKIIEKKKKKPPRVLKQTMCQAVQNCMVKHVQRDL